MSFNVLSNIPLEKLKMFIIHIHRDHSMHIKSFVQLGFNLSSRVTDTLESSSILMY
jgi:hypothetical protein